MLKLDDMNAVENEIQKEVDNSTKLLNAKQKKLEDLKEAFVKA
jgi:hypothetical protein